MSFECSPFRQGYEALTVEADKEDNQLQSAQKVGLLDDRPGRTLKVQAARSFVQNLGRVLNLSRQTEPSLERQLIWKGDWSR